MCAVGEDEVGCDDDGRGQCTDEEAEVANGGG